MNTLTQIVGGVVVLVAIMAVVAALMAIPTMLLVNWLLSETALVAVFGGPLGFWQALGLHFLCCLLFKSNNGIEKK